MFVMKTNNFWGDLTYVSAQTKSLMVSPVIVLSYENKSFSSTSSMHPPKTKLVAVKFATTCGQLRDRV